MVCIFSYNRPAQLDLLLRSMERFTDFDIYVTYLNDKGYEYNQVIKDHPQVKFEYRKKNLKYYVQKALQSPLIGFFCDDDIMLGKVSKNDKKFKEFEESDDIACLSLRLGENVNYSFDRDCPLETFDEKWRWPGCNFDWGYPMSVSGHFFKSKDLKPLIESIKFDNPTQLEGQLCHIPIRKPYMLRYKKQKCVEAPINIVQRECFTNRTGNVSVEWLNDNFKQGKRIDLDSILKTKFSSPHQLIEIKWIN